MTAEPPRTVDFVGGRIWTAGYAASRSLDVLMQGDRIIDVARPGDLDVVGAEVRDLGGRLLIPGFQDAHLHPGTGGADLLGCDLAGLETPDEVYAAIGRYAAAHPELAWIIGGGWNRAIFGADGPRRHELDAVVGGRPAFISPFDRHGAWVSTAALAAAGVGQQTPDPPNGFFTRDADGVLTGMVEEAATDVIKAAMPAQATDERVRATLRAQDHLLSFGITSIQDALVGVGLGLSDHLDAYRELVESSRLRLRLTAALWWEPRRGVEQIPELLVRRKRLEQTAGPERVVADTVKLMVDGADTVFMDEPKLREATVALDAAGFTCHYHSYGDATTHWVLDAIEAAIAENGPKQRRHHIAHLMVVTTPDFARFAELDVTATIQPLWIDSPVPHAHLCHSTMTADPEKREYPYARLQQAGARLAAGSDWPVTSPDPLLAARVAITMPSRSDVPDELDRLDLLSVLTAYTAGSAYVNGRAATTGRIAPGFLADLVVLDRDPFEGGESLHQAVVDEVWIGGRQEFRRGRILV